MRENFRGYAGNPLRLMRNHVPNLPDREFEADHHTAEWKHCYLAQILAENAGITTIFKIFGREQRRSQKDKTSWAVDINLVKARSQQGLDSVPHSDYQLMNNLPGTDRPVFTPRGKYLALQGPGSGPGTPPYRRQKALPSRPVADYNQIDY